MLSYLIIFTIVSLSVYFILYNPKQLNTLEMIVNGSKTENITKPSMKTFVLPHNLRDDTLEKPKVHNGGRYNKNEERCRKILETLYNEQKFPSVRPNWLKNPDTKRNLEIDCYCHELRLPHKNKTVRLGLEYDGRGHRAFTPTFHRNRKEFVGQVKRDKLKNQMCKDNGVYLLRVPDFVRPEGLKRYIVDNLIKMDLLPNDYWETHNNHEMDMK